MITKQELSSFISLVQSSKNPAKLFEIPILTIQNIPHTPLKLGTRKLYADFPRFGWLILYNGVVEYCKILAGQIINEEEFKEYLQLDIFQRANPKNATRRNLEHLATLIQHEKDNQQSPLHELTRDLEKLGISWWIVFNWWFKQPVIQFSVNRYYKNLWGRKILNFVSMLNSGRDYPTQIYKMASDMSVQYLRISPYNPNDFERRPEIFKMLDTSPLSIPKELKALQNVILKISHHLDSEVRTEYELRIQARMTSTFADMVGTVQQLLALHSSGHYLSGYFLLRNLITDLGRILIDDFLKRISRAILSPMYPENTELEELQKAWESFNQDLKEYINSFVSQWIDIVSIDSWGIPHITLLSYKSEKDDSKSITNLENFVNSYYNSNIATWIRDLRMITFKDTVAKQVLDVIIMHREPLTDIINEAVKNKLKILGNKHGKASLEYHKLSDAVHNPVLVDFPPYSSTLEYLGFLHHLRIVNEIFRDVLRVYKNLKGRGERSSPNS